MTTTTTLARGPSAGMIPRKAKERLGQATVGLALVVTSLFYCLPLGRYSVAGVASDFRLYDFAILLFALSHGPALMPGIKRLLRQRATYHYWGAVLLILVWASLVVTLQISGWAVIPTVVIRALRFTAYLLLPAAIVTTVNTPARLHFLLKVFYVNVAIQAMIALAQGLGALPPLWPRYWLDNYGFQAVGTLSPHHKHIGVVMLLGAALTASYLRATKALLLRVLLLGLLGIMITTALLSGSRTSMMGFGLLVVAYAYVHRSRAMVAIPAMALGLAAVGWFGYGLVKDPVEAQIEGRVLGRLDKQGWEGIAGDRTAIYRTMPDLLAGAPWILITGTGFQNVSSYLGATGGHNNYLHVLLELGIIGLFVYLRFLQSILRNLREAAARAVSSKERLVALDSRVAFLAVLGTMMVGETLWAQYSMFTLTAQIMTLVGLATATLNWSRPASPPPRGHAGRATTLTGSRPAYWGGKSDQGVGLARRR